MNYPRAQILNSQSEAATAGAAKTFAQNLDFPGIICLYGTLGMGKSVFARALIRQLCAADDLDVPSPTFTLVQNYEDLRGRPIYHFDLYRLEDPEEIYELGFEDAITEGLCIIEWPERLGALKPGNCIDVHFANGEDGANSRIIKISGLPA